MRVRDVVTSQPDDDLLGSIRERLLTHLDALDLSGVNAASAAEAKERIRRSHERHRQEVVARASRALASRWRSLMPWFADGTEVRPALIKPRLVPVASDTEEADVFRLASLLWSVAVSPGFGRRLRYLVIDASNEKLIGLIALGDPVFNLKVRDDYIGWTVEQRTNRLVGVMDAFVVGSIQPYAGVLGGKLVGSLIGAKEISDAFERKYAQSVGVISGRSKAAGLAMVTVTSALGRSSIYNRLRLPGLIDFIRVGMTEGWGHFHLPEEVFADMRALLDLENHRYAAGNRFGDGPNWRIRVAREALKRAGLDPTLLRHGIARESYVVPLAMNWQRYLCGDDDKPILHRPSASEIGSAAISRWVLPRSERDPNALSWSRDQTAELFRQLLEPSSSQVPLPFEVSGSAPEVEQRLSPELPTSLSDLRVQALALPPATAQ
jgi:hypothetical protein